MPRTTVHWEPDEKMLLARAYFLYVLIIFTTFTWFFIRYRRKLKEKERHQIEMLQNEKYKEILQAKISFFTNITHEIRTPLTLIMGSLNRIIKSGEKKLAENENIAVMSKNTQRLLDLVNQLLDFRKIESSTFLMSFVKLDIKQLLEETYSRFTPIAQTRCIDFHSQQVSFLPTLLYGSVTPLSMSKGFLFHE